MKQYEAPKERNFKMKKICRNVRLEMIYFDHRISNAISKILQILHFLRKQNWTDQLENMFQVNAFYWEPYDGLASGSPMSFPLWVRFNTVGTHICCRINQLFAFTLMTIEFQLESITHRIFGISSLLFRLQSIARKICVPLNCVENWN